MFIPDAGSARADFLITPQLWARLPLELVREVLVMLALTSEQTAREIRLVSRDVNVLVLPLVYRHIIISNPEDVLRLTTTLLPKRKHHIPALKSRLHTSPRPLATYRAESCVLVINDRRPSIETALASIGPVFCGISKLAITARNLQAHAYWLRQHPIRPKTMMLLHYGSPQMVNFYDPIFEDVTHFFTSITHGHRYSTVVDLPSLTHLAVSTRSNLSEATARNIASSLHAILSRCPKLQMLVLVMDFGELPDSEILIPLWDIWLEECLSDDRFVLLPDHRPPRIEWDDIVGESVPSSVSLSYSLTSSVTRQRDTDFIYDTVWTRAERWKNRLSAFSDHESQYSLQKFFEKEVFHLATSWREMQATASTSFAGYRGLEWEIDLVQRDDYQHPKASDPDLKGDGFQSAFG